MKEISPVEVERLLPQFRDAGRLSLDGLTPCRPRAHPSTPSSQPTASARQTTGLARATLRLKSETGAGGIDSARVLRLRRARESGKRARLGFPAAFACQEHGAIGRDCNPLALGFANAFQINTACFDPLARKQIRSPVKCEILLGPQDDPRSIRGDGTIGDLIRFGSLLRCPGLADTFEPMGGPNAAYEGAWAMFRLIESGRLDRESDSRYLITFKRGTREVQLRIEADSARNPFGKTDLLQRFRCE